MRYTERDFTKGNEGIKSQNTDIYIEIRRIKVTKSWQLTLFIHQICGS
jgi:hypothetical protein